MRFRDCANNGRSSQLSGAHTIRGVPNLVVLKRGCVQNLAVFKIGNVHNLALFTIDVQNLAVFTIGSVHNLVVFTKGDVHIKFHYTYLP